MGKLPPRFVTRLQHCYHRDIITEIAAMKILFCFAVVFGATYAGNSPPDAATLCTIAARFGRSNHTACMTTSKAGIPADMKKKMLEKHNTYRAGVSPKAANMQKMVWDDTIADLAQRFAEDCSSGKSHDANEDREVFGHFGVGQNYASGNDYLNAIQRWHGEVKDFTYNGTNVFDDVGHYTQVVWATSNRLGCGAATCPDGSGRIICNYAPAGNDRKYINTPYIASDTTMGSDCPAKKTADGLCDCGGAYCFSNGKLNVKDCSCKCEADTPLNDPDNNCKLNCPGAKEESAFKAWCKGNMASCGKAWLNSVFCPVTCNTCENLEGAYV